MVSQSVSPVRKVLVGKMLTSTSLEISVSVQVTIPGKTAGTVKGWI